jgi:hypothetical protein
MALLKITDENSKRKHFTASAAKLSILIIKKTVPVLLRVYTKQRRGMGVEVLVDIERRFGKQNWNIGTIYTERMCEEFVNTWQFCRYFY